MKTALILAIALLAGCATGDGERVGCLMQAFANGVDGRPEPACIEQIQARRAGRQATPPAPVMHCWRDAIGQNLYCQQQ